MTSAPLAGVGDIVLDMDLTVPAPQQGVLVKVKAREGSNAYKEIDDTNDVAIF